MNNIQYILILFLAILLPACGTTQDKALSQSNSDFDIVEHIVDVEVDNLNNIYILTKENKVVKYTEAFERQYEYSNNLIGEIKSIDASNPQKILCFIQDFNRILVLDNTLAEINIIDLNTSDYLDVSAVARSNDNQIWLFDPINQALVKVNDLVEVQIESNRLSDLNLGLIEPISILERDNLVVVSDPTIGLLVFDNFGQYLKLIPEKGIDEFQIFEEYLFFTQDQKYYQYHIKRYEKSEIPGLRAGADRFIITKRNTYLVSQHGLVVQKSGGE